jgi:hypothetical protein
VAVIKIERSLLKKDEQSYLAGVKYRLFNLSGLSHKSYLFNRRFNKIMINTFKQDGQVYKIDKLFNKLSENPEETIKQLIQCGEK